MITVLQLTFLELGTCLMFEAWENCQCNYTNVYIFQELLEKHGTSNTSLVIANDAHSLGLERNEMQKL